MFRTVTVCVVLLACLFAPGQLVGQEPGYAPPKEGFVVMPFLQRMTQSGVSIVWETPEPMTALVEYGRATLGDNAPRLDQQTEPTGVNTTHTVRIEGLETGTPYFYRAVAIAEDGTRLEGEIRTFKTAVADDGAYSFAVFADSQDNPRIWNKVTTHAYAERPDFAIHGGDLVGDGNRYRDWTEEFFPPAETFMSRVPLFTMLGNHENDADHYYRYFDNPAPEYFYTFDYGNARFFLVDSDRPLVAGSETFQWLDYQLSRSSKNWNFVVLHHPPYTSDENDYGDTTKADALEGDPDVTQAIPLFEKYGVDVVFYGHIHDYERSWPIKGGKVDRENGVTYIQIGGAGGGLENYAPTRRWHTAKVRRTHHFGIARVAGSHFEMQVYDDDWRLFDQFAIDKQIGPVNAERFAGSVPPPAPRITPDPKQVLGTTEVALSSSVHGDRIVYTTDGSTPQPDSPRYDSAITVAAGTTVSARVILACGLASDVTTVTYRDDTPLPALGDDEVAGLTLEPGLDCSYYEGRWSSVDELLHNQPVRMGATSAPVLDELPHREDAFGLVFAGFISIPRAGVWTFETRSDDGSKLSIGELEVVDNDGSHAPQIRKGVVALAAGIHPIRIGYFENSSGQELQVLWSGPGVVRQPIPASAFRRATASAN
jgi:predicted phosphodiesterase